MKLLATTVLALSTSAQALAASPGFLIDFEQSWAYGTAVGSHYAANGVEFTNVLGLSNGDGLGGLPGGKYYDNAPSPLGVAYAQLDGVLNTTAFMNVADGVDGRLAFSYASTQAITGAIKAYSGLNGTGSLLGSFDFAANTSDYTQWTAASLSFSGVAKSFDLSATAGLAALDNISAVPESGTLPMLGLGLAGIAGLGAARRRA